LQPGRDFGKAKLLLSHRQNHAFPGLRLGKSLALSCQNQKGESPSHQQKRVGFSRGSQIIWRAIRITNSIPRVFERVLHMFCSCSSRWLPAMCLILSVSLTACRKSNEPPPPPTGSALIETIKTELGGIATHGEGGSALDEFTNHVELLQKENPAKAEAIQKDFKDLMSASTPEKRKELAKKIQGEL